MECNLVCGDIVALAHSLDQSNLPSEMRPSCLPQLGTVYTVREVFMSAWPKQRPSLYLDEIHNAPVPGYGECGFEASSFRKVTRPSIEALRSLLTPLPELV